MPNPIKSKMKSGKKVLPCPSCGRPTNNGWCGVNGVGDLVLVARKCACKVTQFAVLDLKSGSDTVRAMTDLSPEECGKFASSPAISADEVLAFHYDLFPL